METGCYDNRELSWLKFNLRVLEEAQDNDVPLFERLFFAAIYQSNLDEFFMVRVGSLFDQMLVDKKQRENKTNMTPKEQLDEIFKKVAQLTPTQDNTYKGIMQRLFEQGIQHIDFKSASKEEQAFLSVYFDKEIKPLISPLVIDKKHPFPFLRNKGIYAAARLESKSGVMLGIILAEGGFNRILYLPSKDGVKRFILVEELILNFTSLVFDRYKVLDKALIRITRNADINAEEGLYDEDLDFRSVMEELIKRRKKAFAGQNADIKKF